MNNNLKMREFRLALRDFMLRTTGQDKLIEEYEVLVLLLCRLSDNRADRADTRLGDQINRITEERTINTGNGSFALVGYNPYKLFQKKTLRDKIMQLEQLSRHYGR